MDFFWHTMADSNRRHQASEACALSSWANGANVIGDCIISHFLFDCKPFCAKKFKATNFSSLFFGKRKIFCRAEITGLIIVFVGFVIFCIGRGIVKYTCAYCGARLIIDAESYDNSITIRHAHNESTATQMSTQYCHCSVCGRQSRKRIKNNVGRIKYKYQ